MGASTSSTRSTWRRSPRSSWGSRFVAPTSRARSARKLELQLDGREHSCSLLERRVAMRPGAGGLETLRFDAVYVASGTGSRLTFRDRNFGSRIGWKEVVVRGEDGAELRNASVPAASTSKALRAYPKDLLRSPLDVSTATATFSLGHGPGSPPSLDSAGATQHRGGGFESLVSRGDLSLGVILLSLADRRLLGSSPRAHAGPRQGDRRRLPRRHEGQADRRRPARRHRHDHAHDRRLRARLRHPPALAASSSPRRCIPG